MGVVEVVQLRQPLAEKLLLPPKKSQLRRRKRRRSLTKTWASVYLIRLLAKE